MTIAYSIDTPVSNQQRKPKKHKLTLGIFIERSLAVHGDKYNYSKSVYKGTKAKIEIICKRHGSFWQTPTHHFEGRGCQQCGHEVTASHRRSNTKEFIKRAKEVHADRYDYSKVKYTLKDEPVIITCKEHGDFEQSANNHLRGQNCPKCAIKSMGYTRTNFINSCLKYGNTGTLYVIKCFDEKEAFYKVGITSRAVSERFCSVVEMPYKYEVLYEIESSPTFIFDIERKLHKLLKHALYQPSVTFGGHLTECFTTIKPIEKLLKELSTTEQMQLLA